MKIKKMEMRTRNTNEGANCLGCSLVICVAMIVIVYLLTHMRIAFV